MTDILTVAGTDTLVVIQGGTETLSVPQTETLTITQDTIVILETVAQGLPGPQGIPGAGGSALLQATAGMILNGHMVVKLVNGLAVTADAATPSDAYTVAGITTGAALSGAEATIQFSGLLVEPTWNWTVNQPVFCGAGGVLTQTAPTSGFALVVGYPSTPTSLVVSIKQPIVTA